jgi:hypothetical protein
MLGIDKLNGPSKAAAKNILRERLAHRAGLVARSDHGDRAWT